MASFDFKSEIRRSVKRKRGMLTEVIMRYDPSIKKVLVGDEKKAYNFFSSGIIDRGQTGRVDALQEKIDTLKGALKKLGEAGGGFTEEAEQKRAIGRKKTGVVRKIYRFLNRLTSYVEDFQVAYEDGNEEDQEELRIEYKEDLGIVNWRTRLELKPEHFKGTEGGYFSGPTPINQTLIDNFVKEARKVHKEIHKETHAGGLLSVRSQKRHFAFKLTPEVQKQIDAVAAKRVATGRAQAEKEIAKEKAAGGVATKGAAAPAEITAAAKAGKYITALVDEKDKVLIVLFEPADGQTAYKNSRIVKKLSPNGRKQLFADIKTKNSFAYFMIKTLGSVLRGPPLKARLGVRNRWKASWSLEDLKSKGKSPQKVKAALTDGYYKKVYEKAIQAAIPIKGGEEEGVGTMSDFMKKVSGLTGASTADAFSRRRIPVEESNILEFEKTLQGLKHEKLHNKLMLEYKKLNEEEYIDYGDVKPEDAAAYKKEKDARAARGEDVSQFGWKEYLAVTTGGSMVGKAGRAGWKATKWVFRPIVRVATSGLGQLAGGGTVAGATAAGVGTALLVGASIGATIGLVINWAISGTSLDSLKDRINEAQDNPTLADYMLEVFSTGKGYLCGDKAPDGWQVKCTGAAGGFKQELETSFLGSLGVGEDTEQKYADPTGWRDFEQTQTEGSFTKEDLLEILAYMAILYKEDEKAGLVKTVEKKTKDGKGAAIELQSGSKMLKYKTFYLTRVNNSAERAFSKNQKDMYEMVTLPLVDPNDPRYIVAELKGTPAGKPTGAEKKAAKEAAKNVEQVKEVQKALIEFFGPELEAKLGDEYKQGVLGKNTEYAFFKFSSEIGKDPKFPTGKNQLKEMPKFIRKKAASRALAAADESELEKMVAESKLNLHQKRLLEMNNRLMKF